MAKKPKTPVVKNAKTKARAKREPAPLEPVVHDDSISIRSFQVPRGELFAFTRKPSLSVNNTKISVNSACLEYFPDAVHIHFLVDDEGMRLGIIPRGEHDRDVQKWCATRGKDGKRVPRQITGPSFNAKLMRLTGWNSENRYKLIGQFMCCNGQYLLLFDLAAFTAYPRNVADDEDPQSARIPRFPKEWEKQFGLTVEEHAERYQIKKFKSNVAFGVKGESQSELPLS